MGQFGVVPFFVFGLGFGASYFFGLGFSASHFGDRVGPMGCGFGVPFGVGGFVRPMLGLGLCFGLRVVLF